MYREAALFEVVTPAADAAARRLTTAANVRTMIGSPSTDDTLIDKLADRVSALIAGTYCGLARDAAGTPPTFGLESCKATWLAHYNGYSAYSGNLSYRNHDIHGEHTLLLPWRPAVSITAITEAGVVLTESTDFRLLPGGMVERLRDGHRVHWCWGEIVVEFDTGYELPDDVPDDLEQAAIEQVKFWYLSKARDPSLRSYQVPDVFQASFSVAGGDSIGEIGLLVSVERALTPYRNWAAG